MFWLQIASVGLFSWCLFFVMDVTGFSHWLHAFEVLVWPSPLLQEGNRALIVVTVQDLSRSSAPASSNLSKSHVICYSSVLWVFVCC